MHIFQKMKGKKWKSTGLFIRNDFGSVLSAWLRLVQHWHSETFVDMHRLSNLQREEFMTVVILECMFTSKFMYCQNYEIFLRNSCYNTKTVLIAWFENNQRNMPFCFPEMWCKIFIDYVTMNMTLLWKLGMLPVWCWV